jgi:hypothetical protein
MATTRGAVIRQAVTISRRGFATIDGVNALTATGGGTLTLTDTGDLPPVGASLDLFSDGFLNRPLAVNAADRRKLIGDAAFAPSTGIITHQGPAYVANPTNGTVYLVTQDDLDDWNIAFNEALQAELFQLEYHEFDPVSNTRRQYTPTATPISASWLLDRSQIRRIETRGDGQTANERQWVDYSLGGRTWDTYEDNGILVLDFNFGTPPQTGETIRIVATRGYGTVTSETTSIEVELEWAVLATLWKMAELLGDPTNPDDEWFGIMRRRRVANKLGNKRNKHLGRYAGISASRDNMRKAGPVTPTRTAR